MLCSYEDSSYLPQATCAFLPLIYLRRRSRKDPESSERSFNLFRVVWDRGGGGGICTDAAGGAGGLLWGTAHRYIRGGFLQRQGCAFLGKDWSMYVYQQYATEYLAEWVEIWGLGLVGGFQKKEEHQLPPPCTTCSALNSLKKERD